MLASHRAGAEITGLLGEQPVFTAELYLQVMHIFFFFSKNTSVSPGNTHNLTANEIYCLCHFIIPSAYETRSFAQFLALRLVSTTASDQE